VLREHYGLELVERGISDLAHEGPAGLRKVMGCSLYMPRDFALYLASLLVRPDYGEIARYLAHPSREPDYRAGRGHEDFLVGLDALVGRPLEAAEVSERLRSGLDDAMRSQLDWTDPALPA
jgi:lipoate-protein ligase A